MSPPAVIVSGTIAATPHQGGATWAVLQYLLGLRSLGCRVLFVEPVSDLAGADYCAAVMRRWGFEDDWVLVPSGGGETVGRSRTHLRHAAQGADVLLNVSGMLADPDVLGAVDVRVFLDLDPAFVQLWHAVEGVDMRLDAHTHFVTIADAIGQPGCPIPDCGRTWLPTLPPVVLAEWPVAGDVVHDAFTTVGHWRSYGSILRDGVQYGQKAHSLRQLLALPPRSGDRFVLAMAIHPDETADLDALARYRWELVDPDVVASTPDGYRAFVQGSRAELAIAKSGYVVSGSGWFSDRSACYLASGRPVVAQDTGFGRRLPTGVGLVSFATVDEAAEACRQVRRDDDVHRAAARAIAEEHLDASTVLRSLLDRVGTS